MIVSRALDTLRGSTVSIKSRRSTREIQAVGFVVSDLLAFVTAAAAAAVSVGLVNGFDARNVGAWIGCWAARLGGIEGCPQT
jgi:hypothetical protein